MNGRPARVDGARLWSTLMAMAEIGATNGGGSNRAALSAEDAAGRALFTEWASDAGCEMVIDAIGNLFARYPGGTDGPAVLIGSHLDTQPTGGRFDGVYGVLGGLEVIRTLHDHGLRPAIPVVVADWTNEEGSRFPRSMLGSAVWAGAFPLDDARELRDADGVSIGEALERIGLAARASTASPVIPGGIAAAFELHIEQGPVLEAEAVDIGVVTGVFGLRWFTLEVRGVAAHAGSTPMDRRRDPAGALAAIISGVYAVIAASGPLARATFAQLESEPRSPNTVPTVARCTLDLRHPDARMLERLEDIIRTLIAQVAAERGVDADLVVQNDSAPVVFDPGCVDLVRSSAAALGLTAIDMVSGAGHDSCFVAAVAPTSMVFVPCRGGVSHNEAESITPDDAEQGASVLLGAVLGAIDRYAAGDRT